MGAYGNISQNDAGAVARNVKTYQETTGTSQVQITRGHRATASTTNQWTIAQTASTSQVAADTTRTGMSMTNIGGARVYVRHDGTAPTASLYHTYLDGGDRYEVPEDLVELPVSFLGSAVGGTIVTLLRTAA